MNLWYDNQLESILEQLWDKSWELYPEKVITPFNVEIRDYGNEQKQIAYRKGCCDALDLFMGILHHMPRIAQDEVVSAESKLHLFRYYNGL